MGLKRCTCGQWFEGSRGREQCDECEEHRSWRPENAAFDDDIWHGRRRVKDRR